MTELGVEIMVAKSKKPSVKTIGSKRKTDQKFGIKTL